MQQQHEFAISVLINQFFSRSFVGNQTTNKSMKDKLKKLKKANKRSERKVDAVADELENFSIDLGGKYDFDVDFK